MSSSHMGPVSAFFLGFGVGFVLTFLAVGLLGLPFFFLAGFFGTGGLVFALLAGIAAMVGFLFGAVSLVMFYIWSSLTGRSSSCWWWPCWP